jgi:hypothetical protein
MKRELDHTNHAFEAAEEFAELWIANYYVGKGFDYGYLDCEIEEWGDDGEDIRSFELNFARDKEPYRTIYLTLQLREDGKWIVREIT